MAKANTSPAATVYMWSRDGNGYLCMTGYSIADGSVVSQLQLPAGDGGYGPFTTDALGQLYIPTGSQGSPYFNQILVYAAHANGNDSPIRTIDLPAAWVHVTNIGVDPLGYVYVVSTLYGTGNSYIVQIEVYSPTANGLTKPVRTLQLRNILLPVEGIAADAAGNIYLAAYLKTNTFSGWAVAVYSGTARGVIPPSRVIQFPGLPMTYGIAVDARGCIFVSLQVNQADPTVWAIEEFGPRQNGLAQPLRTIYLPELSYYWSVAGPVRLDGAGNIYTALWGFQVTTSNTMVYGYSPTATGDATPEFTVSVPFYLPNFGLD